MAKRKQKVETEMETLSFAAWVRNKVLQNSEITLEELQAQASTEGRSEKITDKQVIYQAATTIRKRWGVEPSQLPRNKDGSLNMSGMVRLYLDKFGDDATEKKASAYFLTDGLELKPGQFGNAKSTYLRKKGNLDPNKGNGPRARYNSPKGRKAKNGRKRKGQQKQNEFGATVDMLIQTKHFITNVGGFEQARSLMNFLEEIQAL